MVDRRTQTDDQISVEAPSPRVSLIKWRGTASQPHIDIEISSRLDSSRGDQDQFTVSAVDFAKKFSRKSSEFRFRLFFSYFFFSPRHGEEEEPLQIHKEIKKLFRGMLIFILKLGELLKLDLTLKLVDLHSPILLLIHCST